MARLSNIERKIFEKLFHMDSGYVLDFSNNTFYDFIKNSVNINIFDDKYLDCDYSSGSKANRLRCFWDKEPNEIVYKLLKELLLYYEHIYGVEDPELLQKAKQMIEVPNSAEELLNNNLTDEEKFLKQEFEDLDISSLGLEDLISEIINSRINEIKICLGSEAPLASIFMIGSTLEGILLGIAFSNQNKYNRANSAPKYNRQVKNFDKWSLNDFIEVSYEIGFLKEDVYKFSHVLRNFRNYIHPFKQMNLRFNPDKHTAKICWQVLRAAIHQLSVNQ